MEDVNHPIIPAQHFGIRFVLVPLIYMIIASIFEGKIIELIEK
jgi:hypothetical protein